MASTRTRFFAVLIFALSPVIALARAGIAFAASVVRDVGEFVLSAFSPASPRIAFDGPMVLATAGSPLDPALLSGLRFESRTARIGAPRNR